MNFGGIFPGKTARSRENPAVRDGFSFAARSDAICLITASETSLAEGEKLNAEPEGDGEASEQLTTQQSRTIFICGVGLAFFVF